jgi:hypothetical protein
LLFVGTTDEGDIENKGLTISSTFLLTIVLRSGYCGDGHSCPGD